MPIPWIIHTHVGAASLWALATLVTAATGWAAKWLFALQMGAALVAVLAGIDLWHAPYAGLDGPPGHWLAAGTFCAFIALGQQMAIAGPALLRSGRTGDERLDRPALILYRVTAVFLVLAATAMVASAYAS